jgi:hypothetical protein
VATDESASVESESEIARMKFMSDLGVGHMLGVLQHDRGASVGAFTK